MLNANCHIAETTASASGHQEGNLSWSRILVAAGDAHRIADTSHVVVRYREVIERGGASETKGLQRATYYPGEGEAEGLRWDVMGADERQSRLLWLMATRLS